METRLLTSHEVAELVQVSPSAVLRWIDQGLLRAFRTPGGHRRVGHSSLVSFLRTHGMPVPKVLVPAVKLLVIDDEAAFLKSMAALLKRANAAVEVELCDSPISGLVKVGLWRPQVVLLDAYMPGMDGPEVCRRLKADAETSSIAVVAMSGRRSPEVKDMFARAGAAAFLEKPLSCNSLLGALARLGLVDTR